MAVLAIVQAAGFFFCRPARPLFSPLPPQVRSIEGHASFKLVRRGEIIKTRFSFIFLLPDQGRVQVSDPLGGTISDLLFDRGEAFFVLPRKRAYWRASRCEVMSKLLGFALSPEEIIALVSGKSSRLEGWKTEEDSRGRVVRGSRTDLRFEVREFFGSSSLPTLIVFSSLSEEGSLRIRRLNFNQPLKEEVFRPSFLDDPSYESAGWEKIEQWLKNDR